jgi:hypothetical protein
MTEHLIYKGEELSLCEEPLRNYLQTIGKDFKFQAPSTALWRGYIGTWSIESGRLYLIKLRGFVSESEEREEVGLKDLFPDFPEGVFAHWYTGEMRCPKGGLIDYVHGGYASTYEQDLFINVEKGVVLSERVVENGKAEPDAPRGYHQAARYDF